MYGEGDRELIGNMAEKLRDQVWDGCNEIGPYHIENMEMKNNNNQLIISYTTGSFSPEAAKLEVQRMVKRINAQHSMENVKEEK